MVVLGQDYQVVTAVVSVLLDLVLFTVAGHIHFAAEDRFERLQALFGALLVDAGTIVGQFFHAVHYSMVGKGHAAHAVSDSLVYEMRNLGLSVENRVVGVYMQVNEIFHNGVKNMFLAVKVTDN